MADFNQYCSLDGFIFSSDCQFFLSPLQAFWSVASVPTTIGITATRMFHRFYGSLARSKDLSIFSLSFIFILCLYHHHYYYSLESFSHQRQLIVFHWSLSDSKYLQVFRIHLCILAELNTVIWMVSTRLLISMSSNIFTNPLVMVLSAPSRIGISITFMFRRVLVL